jgi:putative photosynthetic complex assembly protein
MSAIDDRPFPRPALFGAAALIGLTILGAGAARWTSLRTPADDPRIIEARTGAPTEVRHLRFSDQPDGSVLVTDANGNAAPVTIAGGGNGFIRGVLRGLARDRRMRGIGQEPAFRLSRWADGRLTLVDEATGRTVDLTAFGPTNRAAFAALLSAPAAEASR